MVRKWECHTPVPNCPCFRQGRFGTGLSVSPRYLYGPSRPNAGPGNPLREPGALPVFAKYTPIVELELKIEIALLVLAVFGPVPGREGVPDVAEDDELGGVVASSRTN